jgi:hypothetical protein
VNNRFASRFRQVWLFFLIVFFSSEILAKNLIKLPSCQVNLGQTSVYGLSSGVFMAAQFQVAFSGTTVGAGIIAGGPFYCVGSSPLIPFLINAETICMNPLPGFAPRAVALLASAKIFAQAGLIDDAANLKNQKIYMFSGMDDRAVTTSVVNQTAAFYTLAEVPAKSMNYVTNIAAGHAIFTKKYQDVACSNTGTPFINDCNFTQSQVILSYIYGQLNPPAVNLNGKIIQFDQSEFVKSAISSMSDTAYAYVSQPCLTQTCKVHVPLHGCEQGISAIGNRFYSTTNYNELADTNNIVVLYPQV